MTRPMEMYERALELSTSPLEELMDQDATFWDLNLEDANKEARRLEEELK